MKSVSNSIATTLTVVVIVLSFAPGTSSQSDPAIADTETMNFASLRVLISLLDTIAERNPTWQATLDRKSSLDSAAFESMIDSLVQRNESDSVISAGIDALLNTPGYQFYFAKFTYSKPEKHREIFYNMPYRYVSAPGDVGKTLLQLFRHREAVEAWMYPMLSQIDLNQSRDIARQWLPKGEYEIPLTYFIYDGMGDAFARDGKVCFDLYGTLLGSLPPEDRFNRLGSIGGDEIVRILAHEFHHIFARPYLNATIDTSAAWQDQWFEYITRQIISEGVATQCNPPKGLRRAMMDDEQIVQIWMDTLTAKINGARDGSISGEEFSKWFYDTYDRSATSLLEAYLGHNYSGQELSHQVMINRPSRPMMIYVLGWWMITKISQTDSGRDRVIKLLSDPMSVYAVYDSVAAIHPDYPRINIARE